MDSSADSDNVDSSDSSEESVDALTLASQFISNYTYKVDGKSFHIKFRFSSIVTLMLG